MTTKTDEITSVRVASLSVPDVTYLVRLRDGVPYDCTCPHHQNRGAICKHIREVENSLE